MKEFSLEVIVSAYEGHLICEFALMHEFIEYCAGSPIMTHALPWAMDQLRPGLEAQHPWLKDAPGPPSWVDDFPSAAMWASELAKEYGAVHSVAPVGLPDGLM